MLIEHDNWRPHGACASVQQTTNLRLESLPHPLYSPDLALCDYHVFGPLKDSLNGKKFNTDEEIKKNMHKLTTVRRFFFLHALNVVED